MRKKGFPPLGSLKPRILILGSMPSERSLEKVEYYGHGQNHFWPMLFEIYGQALSEEYDEKVALLRAQEILLWDVYESCERQGSLDQNIKEPRINDLMGLLEEHPTIEVILLNGTKAYQAFKRHVGKKIRTPYHKMPSTSPIPGKYNKSYEEKVAYWSRYLL